MDLNILNKEQPKNTPPLTVVPDETPAKVDPLDPAPLLKLFTLYGKEINKMEAKAADIEVTDDESNSTAVEMTTQAKKLAQIIEKMRVKAKAPYLNVTSVLDKETKPLKDRLGVIQTLLNKTKIGPFLQKKEQERLKKEREANEKAAAIQKKLNDDRKAEEARVAEEARQKAIAEGKDKEQAEQEAQEAADMVEAAPVVVAETVEETKVETDAGTAKLNLKWTWDIEDFRKLPDAVFEARREQIIAAMKPYFNAQIAAGIRKIEGVKIYQEQTIATRTK